VSAQIGAQAVAAAAEALESAIRQHLDEVERLLSPLIQSLRQRLTEAGRQTAHSSIDLDRGPRLRDELVAMLQDSNAASEPLFKENEALIQAVMGDGFAAFARAMRACDFSEALEQLLQQADTPHDTGQPEK
jgi:hypothetical protein